MAQITPVILHREELFSSSVEKCYSHATFTGFYCKDVSK